MSAQVIKFPRERGLTAILAKAREQRREIDQLYLDTAHWNRTRPDEEPIDCDPDGDLRRTAEMLDALLASIKAKL